MARTADNFDLYQINPVKVSRRDGMNYVFNGQHTIEIVAAVSGSRETPVWCMVYDDMDYEVEADVFASQQKYVKTLSSYEIFQANVEAGNDEQSTMSIPVPFEAPFRPSVPPFSLFSPLAFMLNLDWKFA